MKTYTQPQHIVSEKELATLHIVVGIILTFYRKVAIIKSDLQSCSQKKQR